MASNAARKPGKDPDARDHDKTDDAHDPNKTDAEAIARAYGGRNAEERPTSETGESENEGPVPRTKPARTYTVNADGEARPADKPAAAENVSDARPDGEVRAGPGDAGAQSAPRVLDNPRDKPARSFTPIGLGIAVAIVVVLVILMAL